MGEKTAKERRAARWRTKRYAMHELRDLLRDWARARRAAENTPYDARQHEPLRQDASAKCYQVIGAMHALYRIGALTEEQMRRIDALWTRIHGAKVARRPFVELRRAA